MRSVALLALLVAFAAGVAITPQPLTAPAAGASFGLPLEGSTASIWADVGAAGTSTGAKTYTYTLGGADVGKNFYFRVTLYACDTPGTWSFQTQVSGNDGTGSIIPPHSGDFTVKSASTAFSAVDPITENATVLIASGADSAAKASGKTWTYTVSIVGTTAVTCSFYADLISYGKLISSSSVGKDGNPGATQDAWIPCCDSVQSAYQVAMTDMPHKYLEVSAMTDKGGFDALKLTNPGSLIGLVDVTSFPSATHVGTVTARTCLSNQSCEILTANYFVELVTHGYGYYDTDAKDFHATFTLTTKAGVATASATIAFAVAALFALFH